MRKESCETCHWCNVDRNGQSECRAKSPIALPMQQKTALGQVDVQVATIWPPVQPDVWCGDYKFGQIIAH